MGKIHCTVNEAAKIFSMSPERVRGYCHAPKQNFAFKPPGMEGKKGKDISIDIRKFKKYIEGYPV